MAGKKVYAVAKGHKPGVYTAWFGENGAEAQVRGYPGAVFKGFTSVEEAQAWLREHAVAEAVPPAPEATSATTGASAHGGSPSACAPSAKGDDLRMPEVTIYTDGACLGNPGPGGYGVVLMCGEHRKELSGGYRLTTNNRMEIMAVIAGLKALKTPCCVTLYSDSEYLVKAMTKGWVERWRSRGWMRNAKKPALNADLWEELYQLCQQHRVEFRWVRGHAGNPANERCDTLAQAIAVKGDALPPDEVYEQLHKGGDA